ncbi:MAG: hypothetical protein QOH79_2023, partial [Acidimicrobiaceae bacterium]
DGLGTSWRKVGGQLVGGPAATVLYAGDGGVITVVVRGSDNAAWITYVYPTGPTTYVWDSRGFMSLGGILTSDPAVGSVGSLYVFGRGTDGALWLYNGSTWQSLEGQLIGGPGAAETDSPGSGFVAVQGTDHALWTRTWTFTGGSPPVSWSPWSSLGGQLTADPDVGLDCHDGEVVAVTGTDHALWLRSPSTPWISHGGTLTSAPSVGWASDATTSSFVQDGRGTNNALWTRTDNTGC